MSKRSVCDVRRTPWRLLSTPWCTTFACFHGFGDLLVLAAAHRGYGARHHRHTHVRSRHGQLVEWEPIAGSLKLRNAAAREACHDGVYTTLPFLSVDGQRSRATFLELAEFTWGTCVFRS